MGKQLLQYVCVRIIRLDNVDIGLFDWDRNNTLYYFMLNADEQIYMRFGGRDSQSQDTYLNLDSLALALEQGLELHKQYGKGELKKTERPKPLSPRDFPLLVERTFARGACVECHLVSDFQNIHRELDGTLDKPQHLWRSPDIGNIGIQLDVPKGLAINAVQGAVAAAGMLPGDLITHLNGTPVWTFGDFQYAFDKVDRRAEHLQLAVSRAGKPVQLNVALPRLWWVSEIRWRQSGVDPRVYFDSRILTEAEKRRYALKPEGFAGMVKSVDAFAQMVKSHELKTGDIVFGVDGVEIDPIANTPEFYIKLRKKAGDTVTLNVLRDGKRIEMPLRTYRMAFRK